MRQVHVWNAIMKKVGHKTYTRALQLLFDRSWCDVKDQFWFEVVSPVKKMIEQRCHVGEE